MNIPFSLTSDVPMNPMMAWLTGIDAMGSVLFASQGAAAQSYAYSAFGEQAAPGSEGSVLGFNGQRRDPLNGHYHLGNGYRSYSPALMQFLAPDSLSPFGAGGLNPYAYCVGDPINRADPSGHFGILQGLGLFVTLASIAMCFVPGGGFGAALIGAITAGVSTGLSITGESSLVAPEMREVWLGASTSFLCLGFIGMFGAMYLSAAMIEIPRIAALADRAATQAWNVAEHIPMEEPLVAQAARVNAPEDIARLRYLQAPAREMREGIELTPLRRQATVEEPNAGHPPALAEAAGSSASLTPQLGQASQVSTVEPSPALSTHPAGQAAMAKRATFYPQHRSAKSTAHAELGQAGPVYSQQMKVADHHNLRDLLNRQIDS